MLERANIQRVIIVHGWADDPTQGWMGWLTRELRAQGIEVVAPAMPEPKKPNIEDWLAELERVAGRLDAQTALVGHSLGAYVVLRYMSKYVLGESLGKLILVAGFAGHERAEQGKRALPEVDFGAIKAKVGRIYSVYSDNDEIIPPAWSRELGTLLGAENVVDPGKGHFAGLHGCDTLPSVFDLIVA